MRVKIKQCSDSARWYVNKIGEEFDVVDYINAPETWWQEANECNILLKSDCEIVVEQKESKAHSRIELSDLPRPLGDFILAHAEGKQFADGTYYHYTEVHKLLRQYAKLNKDTEPIGCGEPISDSNSFSSGCELRIGRRKLNLPKNDLLHGAEYRYGIVTHWFRESGETKYWSWDADYIVPPTSMEIMLSWNNELQLAFKKPVLELDELTSAYIEADTINDTVSEPVNDAVSEKVLDIEWALDEFAIQYYKNMCGRLGKDEQRFM